MIYESVKCPECGEPVRVIMKWDVPYQHSYLICPECLWWWPCNSAGVPAKAPELPKETDAP